MASVTIHELTKFYGQLEVVKGISAEIADGEFVVLVGPSGCGKSTLLRMIAGLEDITGGQISIDGEVVNDVASKDRDIAMVFQNYALYPHMTVAQNMGFSLELRKFDKRTIAARVAEAAESLGLTHLLERYPRQLSGGQRQRVATGRAIVRDPQIFLFDEPLSNLDAKLRVQMRTELRELHQRLKVTSIYVTHDQIEAMTMADKIIVLRDGHIMQVGRPLDLYDHPANTFVATFIGSPAMNLFEGTASGQGFTLATGTTLLPTTKLAPGEKGTVGLRPEHIEISREINAGLPATVKTIEPMGAETMVLLDFGGQSVTVMSRERYDLDPGTHVSIVPNTAQAHVFGADGNRID
jgi:multiple sugar transport system ATP-binding protein